MAFWPVRSKQVRSPSANFCDSFDPGPPPPFDGTLNLVMGVCVCWRGGELRPRG